MSGKDTRNKNVDIITKTSKPSIKFKTLKNQHK